MDLLDPVDGILRLLFRTEPSQGKRQGRTVGAPREGKPSGSRPGAGKWRGGSHHERGLGGHRRAHVSHSRRGVLCGGQRRHLGKRDRRARLPASGLHPHRQTPSARNLRRRDAARLRGLGGRLGAYRGGVYRGLRSHHRLDPGACRRVRRRYRRRLPRLRHRQRSRRHRAGAVRRQ